jgi:nucleoside 2-deoxyribosyltransferase
MMPKRFYLATRKDRSEEAMALMAALKTHGWERTYAWTATDGAGSEEYPDIALKELKGVAEADALIVLLPGGYGTHVEIGAALALGKRVILHAPDRKTLETPYPCPFHYHPSVKLIISKAIDVDAFLRCLPRR